MKTTVKIKSIHSLTDKSNTIKHDIDKSNNSPIKNFTITKQKPIINSGL